MIYAFRICVLNRQRQKFPQPTTLLIIGVWSKLVVKQGLKSKKGQTTRIGVNNKSKHQTSTIPNLRSGDWVSCI